MIKVGDRFSLNNEKWEVIFIDNDSVAVARSENREEGIVSQRTIYKNWYEHQKQRADELEKRWHKMKAILDGVWKYGDADEHEIAYDLLNRMQRLEEDNNDTRNINR